MKPTIKNNHPTPAFTFKKFKTYAAAEIIAAGGTSEFAKLTGYDHNALFNLKGDPLTDEELEVALQDLV